MIKIGDTELSINYIKNRLIDLPRLLGNYSEDALIDIEGAKVKFLYTDGDYDYIQIYFNKENGKIAEVHPDIDNISVCIVNASLAVISGGILKDYEVSLYDCKNIRLNSKVVIGINMLLSSSVNVDIITNMYGYYIFESTSGSFSINLDIKISVNGEFARRLSVRQTSSVIIFVCNGRPYCYVVSPGTKYRPATEIDNVIIEDVVDNRECFTVEKPKYNGEKSMYERKGYIVFKVFDRDDKERFLRLKMV